MGETVKGDLKTLRALFNKAIEWGYLKENPCKKIKPPTVKENPPSFLAVKEIERLLKAAKGTNLHAFVAAAVYTGMRKGELIHLEWSDVDFESETITVINKEAQNFHTKSKKFRAIPLHEKLRPILTTWKKRSLALQKGKGTQYCFPNGEGGLWLHNLGRNFPPLLKKAEIKKVRFHDLRHTFASLLAIAGVDIYQIAHLLGHSSIRTTQIYAHLIPNQIDINKF